MKFKQLFFDSIRIIKLSSRNNHLTPLLFVGSICFSILPFISLVFSSLILDSVLNGNYEISFNYVLALTISTFVISIIVKYCDKMIEATSEYSENNFEEETLRKAFTVSYQEFEQTNMVDQLRYIESARNGSGGVLYQIFTIYSFLKYSFASLIAFIFMIVLFLQVDSNSSNFFTSIWSSLVLILIYLCVFVFSMKIQRNANDKTITYAKKNMHINTVSQYLLTLYTRNENANDARVYNLKDLFTHYINKYFLVLLPMYMEWGVTYGKASSLIDFTSKLFSAVAYIFVGAKAIYGVITIGNVFMYAGAITQFSQYILKTLEFIEDIEFRNEYLSENERFINQPSKYYIGTLPIEKRDDNEYEIELKNVSFKYPNSEKYVLENINYKFKLGSRIALVGLNGAGKTTLVKLLTKLYEPTSGEICLNGININKYDFNEYINIFSVVFQDFQLFSYPINQNIAGSDSVNMDKMKTILSDLHILHRVESFQNGLDTFVNNDTESGVHLSGGEAQKIAICRALYKDAPFIIMDEPTAALDPLSEAEIYKEFNDIVKNKTSIFISHRMSSCIFCDEILVIDKGKICERGNHNQLLNNHSLYYELWNAQSQHYTQTA